MDCLECLGSGKEHDFSLSFKLLRWLCSLGEFKVAFAIKLLLIETVLTN